jgi:hypothetical protein
MPGSNAVSRLGRERLGSMCAKYLDNVRTNFYKIDKHLLHRQ